jgi:PAS domain S-box-containing protein
MKQDSRQEPTGQRALGSIEEQHQLLMECVTDYAIFLLDPQGRVATWNAGAERILGYAEADILGQPFARFFTPEDVQGGAAERELERAAAQGRCTDDRWHVRKDGSRLWASGVTTALRDEQGQLRGFAKVMRDQSLRKQLDEEQRLLADGGAVLAASLDYEATLQSVARLVVPAFADFCVIHLASDGGELRQVAAAHADPGKEYLLHEMARVHRPGDHPQSLAGQVLRTGEARLVRQFSLATAEAVNREAPLLRIIRALDPRSALIVPLVARGRTLGTVSLLTAESGRRYGAAELAFAQELARRAGLAVDNARLYSEVREANRRKDEWLSMLAHELRNPLAPIRNGLYILRLAGGDARAAGQALGMMERQVRHLVRLIDDLLEATRVVRGKIRLRPERLDLAGLVRTTAEDRRLTLEEAGLALRVEVAEAPLWLSGDGTRLAQILNNLLDNAAKFTNRGGRVVVRLAADAELRQAVLRVADDGVGIEPDMLPRLFEPFNQADHSLDRSKGGLGLGLALVKGLTELHGGEVEAFSQGPGQGAEFVVRLPWEPESVPPARAAQVNENQ